MIIEIDTETKIDRVEIVVIIGMKFHQGMNLFHTVLEGIPVNIEPGGSLTGI